MQFHLAGHTDLETHCIDTHDGRVVDTVWQLYREAVTLTGGAATLLEWDAKIPTFEEVHAEALKAKTLLSLGPPSKIQNLKSQISDPAFRTPRSALPHPPHLVPAEAE
jgi:uncharacterized protein (UPF0276 family)